MNNTTTQSFFDQKYTAENDPWHFLSSPYERLRYEHIMRALEGRRYRRVFEPGCSIGALTQRLATCCDRVIATDISSKAIRIAKARCKALRNVTFQHQMLSEKLPGGDFDLVMFSEIGYYFRIRTLREILHHLVQQLRVGGDLLAVHWLGVSSHHVLSGDQVHRQIAKSPYLEHTLAYRYEQGVTERYRLDRWTRV